MVHANNAAQDVKETELKFKLLPGGITRLESHRLFTSAAVKQIQQLTTYFDTKTRVLDRANLTLRVRKIGKLRIQTLKGRVNNSSAASCRSEREWEINQNTPDVGKLKNLRGLAKIAQQIDGRLKPVFYSDIQRTVRVLHLEQRCIVEAVIDIGWIRSTSASEPVAELELELKAGEVGPLYELAAELQKCVPLRISTESKAARGWHLHLGQTVPASNAQPLKLRRSMSVAEGMHMILGARLGHLVANIEPTLRGDTEGLHQMRIALRSCRSALNLFRPHLDKKPTVKFDKALQHLGRVLGNARDWDVFCKESLPAATVEMPLESWVGLSGSAEVERQKAHALVANRVSSKDFGVLILQMSIWIENGLARPKELGDESMGRPLKQKLSSLLDRISQKVSRKSRHPMQLPAEKLHKLRKSLDQLCNDIESIASLYPARSTAMYLQQCENVQNILGRANDCVVTRQLSIELFKNAEVNLREPTDIMILWSAKRRLKILTELKSAVKQIKVTPVFWS